MQNADRSSYSLFFLLEGSGIEILISFSEKVMKVFFYTLMQLSVVTAPVRKTESKMPIKIKNIIFALPL